MQAADLNWDELPGRRPSHDVNANPLAPFSGKRVLVTGAAGCIGGALADALLLSDAASIVLVDISEQGIYELQRHVDDRVTTILGDICEMALLSEIFNRFSPQIVFHAAAFKHVPLLEHNPFAAIANNGLGTARLATFASSHGCDHFILVSTDKAADPASVMGASKRIAEMALLDLHAAGSKTRMTAVRLGNVLDSPGSIVPLFTTQIFEGVAITVTHPDVERYFITIEEASAALLEAAAPQYDSGILLPRMGDPVRVVDMAIHLFAKLRPASPEEPRLDYIGLRPGDKLKEVLLASIETLGEAANQEVHAPLRRVTSPCPSSSELAAAYCELEEAIRLRDLPQLVQTIMRIIPAYKPSSVISARLQQPSTVPAGGCR